MNLIELNEFIAAIPTDEPEMLTLYKSKRVALVAEINVELTEQGLPNIKITV